MQRLRLRYTKRGRLRFTSHRDFGRAFERAVRRADLPIAYSSGFSPHPRISYANASPTGAASEAEYLEIGLRQGCDPAEVLRRLDAALPDGLDVLEVVTAAPGSLSDRLEASSWQIRLEDVAPDAVAAAVEVFLACESVTVERMTKKGLREFDCREAVVGLAVVDVPQGSRLDLVLRHTVPAVRPDDVLTGIARLTAFDPGPAPLLTRVEQGPLVDGSVGDPFL